MHGPKRRDAPEPGPDPYRAGFAPAGRRVGASDFRAEQVGLPSLLDGEGLMRAQPAALGAGFGKQRLGLVGG